MLVQAFRRTLPGSEAFFERTLLRGRDFTIAVLRSNGIALDRGVLQGVVDFPRRGRRRQLSLVLAGRGYVDAAGRVLSIGAGEVLASDQTSHRGEGYGGRRAEVLLLDWEETSALGGSALPASRVTALGTREVASLRQHLAALRAEPPQVWVADLARRLRSIGLVPETAVEVADADRAPARLARLYDGLGDVLARLDRHPSLPELAAAVGASDRQTKRHLQELRHSYAHGFDGWRDFLHEMRLDWATQLLSVEGLGLREVSVLAGYRSPIALHHAFQLRGAATPSVIARRLAERWR